MLLDWSVKVVNAKLSSAKRRKITGLIARLVEEYQPEVLVTKRLHSSRSSRTARSAESAISRTSPLHPKSHFCNIPSVKWSHFFSPGERTNKTKLSEMLCQKHPVLRHELRRERNNDNPYYVRMFEAVALGTMAGAKRANMYHRIVE